MRFSVSGEKSKQAVKEYIDKLKDDREYTVEITAKKQARSLSQNRLYWLWLTCIENETGNDREILHHEFGMMFLPLRSGSLNGKIVELPISTTSLDVNQFRLYLDKIQVFSASELGIGLPNPEDLIFESFYEAYKDRI